MKKNASLILVLLITFAFFSGTVGCQKLKVDNLKANYHLKAGNGLYGEEKWRQAAIEYETALQLNPELKSLYLYLGTSYSQLFRPMKKDERNEMYGTKAIDYLKKALDYYPDDDPKKEQTIFALGDIYDKMGKFEDSEQYYLMILNKDKNNPKYYYILADFYSKYNKNELAESMHLKRIALDPKDPEGYHYYGGYLSGKNLWDKSVEVHKMWIYSLYDQDQLMLKIDIEKLKTDIKQAEAVTKNIDVIRKNKLVDKTEKERLIGEAEERLKEWQPLEEMKVSLEEKTKAFEEGAKSREEKLNALDEEGKKKVMEAFYTLGVVCWTKSFRTPPHMMAAEERTKTLDEGMDALEQVLKLDPKHDMSYNFIGLIWRQRILVNNVKRDEYMAKWKENFDIATEIREKRLKKEKLREQLEQMDDSGE